MIEDMTTLNRTEEGQQKKEAIKTKIDNILSLIREQIGKEERDWNPKIALQDFLNTRGKGLLDEEVVSGLYKLADSEREREYIDALKVKAIQDIYDNDNFGEAKNHGALRDIKTHYGYSGPDILTALMPKYSGKKVDWRRMYRINSDDFLVYFTEKMKRPIKIDDIKKYLNGSLDETTRQIINNYFNNTGITEKDLAAFVEKSGDREKANRWKWTQVAMDGMNPKTIEITFDQMEKNILQHPELKQDSKMYYKAMEIAIDNIKAKEDKSENSIREEVNKALIKAA